MSMPKAAGVSNANNDAKAAGLIKDGQQLTSALDVSNYGSGKAF